MCNGARYNSRDKRVEIVGGGGHVKAHFPDDMSRLTNIKAFTGTTPQCTVGTAGVAVATISNMTGVAINDKIIAMPDTALLAAVGFAGALVATTNTVVVRFVNPNPASVGTQAPVGWHVMAFRNE